MGFGRNMAELYGLGDKFDEQEEEHAAVSRFFADVGDSEKSKHRNSLSLSIFASLFLCCEHDMAAVYAFYCSCMMVV